MSRRFRFRFAVSALVLAIVAIGLSANSAQAAVAQVVGVTSAGEDNYNARLKVRWRPVPGATYQTRWASSVRGLARAVPQSISRSRTTSPELDRCTTHYFQVRAVKRGLVGRWSVAKAMKFRNRYPAPPVLNGVGLENAVRFTWNYASNATNYRLRWNAAPFGKFVGGDAVVGGWTDQHARSRTVQLPTAPAPGDKMMGVAYANPVFGQIDSRHVCITHAAPHSKYLPVFPQAPEPGPGDDLRLGTYNVELSPNNIDSPQRVAGIVKNIVDHDLSVVAVQEANSQTATSLLANLPTRWRAASVPTRSAQQILYDGSVFRSVSSGAFDVVNPVPGANPLVTPWVKLQQVDPSSRSKSQTLMVVSIHFAENPSNTQMDKKRDAHLAALAAMDAIDAANPSQVPVVVAGDLRYLREPFNDVPGYVEGPPTFVRGGYYDAMAALTKTGVQFTTVSQKRAQVPSASGVASRSDYILLKGFEGSRAYVNLANWTYNGTFVSDHNLVYADITIPYLP